MAAACCGVEGGGALHPGRPSRRPQLEIVAGVPRATAAPGSLTDELPALPHFCGGAVYPGGPYGFYHHEGWVADAALPPPAGTVPLYLYWDPTREDNATATAASAPPAPWSRGALLGHVWTTPAPGRVALRLWYSSARKDYLTTTRTLDLTSEGYARVGASGIIGYVRTAGSLD